MEILCYRAEVRDKARDQIVNWDFDAMSKKGRWGNGIYLYVDQQTNGSPGLDYLRQLDGIDNLAYQLEMLVCVSESFRLLDFDTLQANQDLEDIKNIIRQKCLDDPRLKSICSDPQKLDVYAIKKFCELLPVSIYKRSLNFKSVVTYTNLPDKLITHICVINPCCISKSSVRQVT